jgi:hypothetical protein
MDWLPWRPGRGEILSEDAWMVAEGGWRLHGRIRRPRRGVGRLGAVLVVPGLGATAADLDRSGGPVLLSELADLGAVVLGLDPSGRGGSWGLEDYGGPVHQADVRTALGELASRPEVDPARLGVISLSLGTSAVAGALASGHRPGVAWWIDWEGPSDREIITSGGRRMEPAMGHALDDDAWWQPREAVHHVGRCGVPWIRCQSVRDHAQPGELRHAERLLLAASSGSLPWFQLNDHPPGEVPAVPRWLPGGMGVAREWIRRKVRELLGG